MEHLFDIEAIDMSRCNRDRISHSLYIAFAKCFFLSNEFGQVQISDDDEAAEFIKGYPDAGLSTDRGILPNARSALILATIARVGNLMEAGISIEESDLLIQAESRLRYLIGCHISGPYTCSDALQWGMQGRSPRAAAMTSLAGWLLYPDLDDIVLRGISDMLFLEADRLVKVSPLESAHSENIMETYTDFLLCLSTVCAMYPRHIHWEKWNLRLKHLALNRLSGTSVRPKALHHGCILGRTVEADLSICSRRGLDPSEWAESSSGLGQCAVPFLMGKSRIPDELKSGVIEVWTALEKLFTWDGTPLCVQGTSAGEKQLYFTAVAANSILLSHSSSTYLHDVYEAVSEKADIPIKDPFYFLLKLFGGEPAPLVPGPGFTQEWEGCFEFPEAGFCVHRTPTKMSSFSWKRSIMALALPEFGGWLIHPENWSMVGKIEAEDCDNDTIMLAGHTCIKEKASFTITVDLRRCDHALSHRIAFASLPNDGVVFLDSLLSLRDVALTRERVGIISIFNCDRYGRMLSNQRHLYSVDGEIQVIGVCEDKGRTLNIPGNWINLDDQVGYVVWPGNRMSYLDLNSYPLSQDGLEMDFGEKLILITNDYEKRYSARQEIRRGMILMGLNQNHRQTRKEAEEWVSVTCPQDSAAALWAHHLVVANFSDFSRCLELYVPKGAHGEYTLFLGEQRITEDDVALIIYVEALSTRILPALFTLKADSALRVDITARGLDEGRLEMKNNTEGLIEVATSSVSTALEGVFELLPGSRQIFHIGT